MPTTIREGQTFFFSGKGYLLNADIDRSFSVDIIAIPGMTVLYDTIYSRLSSGDSIDVRTSFHLLDSHSSSGNIEICFRLDCLDEIAESDEGNNTACTVLEIEETPCDAHPNPFTPNGDNTNDRAIIEFPGSFTKTTTIKIFDLDGNPVRRIETTGNITNWDGADDTGAPLPRGTYIYLILREGKVVCKGAITLAR